MSRNARLLNSLVQLTMLIVGLFPLVPIPIAAAAEDKPPPKSAVVFRVQDPLATEAFATRPDRIKSMVDLGVKALTGKATVEQAWSSLVSTQDIIGLKVYSLPGPYSGTRPAVVAAVIEGLVAAGIPPKNIVLWDRHLANLRLAGFHRLEQKYGVRLAGAIQSGHDRETYYENPVLGNLVWGDVEFGESGEILGRNSYVSNLVSKELTRHINIAPLLNHTSASVSGVLLSLALGSVDNIGRFESHPERLAVAVPEIYALPDLSDKVALSIVDGLICQYEGGEKGRLHSSATLNELRFSLDPVALDVLSIEELEKQRQKAKAPKSNLNKDLYTNAALLELGVADPAKIRVEDVK